MYDNKGGWKRDYVTKPRRQEKGKTIKPKATKSKKSDDKKGKKDK